MSNDYTLKFDLSPYIELDKFALLADQDYNLGDSGDWFNHFRGGLYGLYARVQGVLINYYAVHSWNLPEPFMSSIQRAEYHLSAILFNMDSTIECMIFALNALGYITDSKQFKDVTNEKELTNISPYNILGKPPNYTAGFVQGYDNYFPLLKGCWHQNRDLIQTIFAQHDVSKHRSVIFSGGKMRDDPPPGFFEQLGIAGNEAKQWPFCPWAEIILTYQPKTPWRQRKPHDHKHIDKLEDIAERFCEFINMCGLKALEDAKSNIKLTYYEFKQ
jgi:hypothetical protein